MLIPKSMYLMHASKRQHFSRVVSNYKEIISVIIAVQKGLFRGFSALAAMPVYGNINMKFNSPFLCTPLVIFKFSRNFSLSIHFLKLWMAKQRWVISSSLTLSFSAWTERYNCPLPVKTAGMYMQMRVTVISIRDRTTVALDTGAFTITV